MALAALIIEVEKQRKYKIRKIRFIS